MNCIWKFETDKFEVRFEALEEFEDFRDITDESLWQETSEKIESGEWVIFCAKVSVILKYNGEELASDFLGSCIYESYEAFMNHRGLAAKSRKDGCNYSSYFSGMVKTAIAEARKVIADKAIIYQDLDSTLRAK